MKPWAEVMGAVSDFPSGVPSSPGSDSSTSQGAGGSQHCSLPQPALLSWLASSPVLSDSCPVPQFPHLSYGDDCSSSRWVWRQRWFLGQKQRRSSAAAGSRGTERKVMATAFILGLERRAVTHHSFTFKICLVWVMINLWPCTGAAKGMVQQSWK